MASELSVAPDAIVALVTDGARLALTLGGARPWDGSQGETLAPLSFPSTPAAPDAGGELALQVGSVALGCALELAPAPWTYGPSARRAMDRAPADEGAPFLRYERFDAPEDGVGAPRRMLVRVYRARVTEPGGGGKSAVIWAPLAALRAALGGIWLEELLTMESVTLVLPVGSRSALEPASTLVYLPAVTGERHTLRACAKYGDAILIPEDQPPHEAE